MHLLLHETFKVIFCANRSVDFIVNLCSFPSKELLIGEMAE